MTKAKESKFVARVAYRHGSLSAREHLEMVLNEGYEEGLAFVSLTQNAVNEFMVVFVRRSA